MCPVAQLCPRLFAALMPVISSVRGIHKARMPMEWVAVPLLWRRSSGHEGELKGADVPAFGTIPSLLVLLALSFLIR